MFRSANYAAPLLHERAAVTSRDTARVRLSMLDGLRGLAALYVALFHAVAYTGYADTPSTLWSAPMRWLATLLSYGTYAVPVFIVLSGFCLMLPLAQRQTLDLPGGTALYLRRRAWRILPPYYAALALSIAVIALVPIMQLPHNTAWDTKVPVTLGGVISHLLLLHNANEGLIYQINGPMWSIAVEWQIYFLFPAILLPLWRRAGLAAMLSVALLLGVLPRFLLPHTQNFDWTHPWFAGLFAMGMAAAALAFSERSSRLGAARWRWLNWALLVPLVGGLAWDSRWMELHAYLSEPLVGAIVALALARYAVAARGGARRSWAQQLIESRMLVGLGTFSYSMYLLHNPIQAFVNLQTLDLPISADARLGLMLGIATPVSLLFAYLFYLLVERRFVRIKERVAPAAA